LIAEARTWPTTVADRQVAVRMGVSLHYVQLARRTRS
jgi:hypothetical protein